MSYLLKRGESMEIAEEEEEVEMESDMQLQKDDDVF